MVDIKSADTKFWRFSLHVYAHKDVEKCCLYFQDTHSLDVNMLLLMAWTGFSGAKLTTESVVSLCRHSLAWQETAIKPLRQLRQALKKDIGAVTSTMSAELRKNIKEAELESEKLQQKMLYDLVMKMPAKNAREGDRKSVARQNILGYLNYHQTALDKDIKIYIEKFLSTIEGQLLTFSMS